MDVLSNKEYDEEYRSKMQEIIDRASKIALALKDNDMADEERPRLRRSFSTSSSRKRHTPRHNFTGYEASAQSDEERLQRISSRRRSLSRHGKSSRDSSEWKVSMHNPMSYENLYQQQIHHPVSQHQYPPPIDKGLPMFDPYQYGPYAIPHYPPYHPDWTSGGNQPESPYMDDPAMMGYFGHQGHMHTGMLQPHLPTDFVPQEFPELYAMHPPPPPPHHHPPPHPPLAMPPMLPMHAMMMENEPMSSPMLLSAMLPHHLPMDPVMDPAREPSHTEPLRSPPAHMLSPRQSIRQAAPIGMNERKWCFRTVSDEHGEQWTAFDDNNQMLLQESGPDDSTAYEIMDSHIERGRKKIMVLPHLQYCFYHLHGQMIKLPISLRKMTSSPLATSVTP
ncbi:hypothetical protein Unana1_07584 [Umbelopsis nana]